MADVIKSSGSDLYIANGAGALGDGRKTAKLDEDNAAEREDQLSTSRKVLRPRKNVLIIAFVIVLGGAIATTIILKVAPRTRSVDASRETQFVHAQILSSTLPSLAPSAAPSHQLYTSAPSLQLYNSSHILLNSTLSQIQAKANTPSPTFRNSHETLMIPTAVTSSATLTASNFSNNYTSSYEPSSIPSAAPSIVTPSGLHMREAASNHSTSFPSLGLVSYSVSPSTAPTSTLRRYTPPSPSPSIRAPISIEPTQQTQVTAQPQHSPTIPLSKSPLIFYLTGDVPYAFNEIALLNNQVTSLPTDGQFLVHVGDINKANLKTSCYEENYTTLKTIMLNAPNPVFVLAGDNDIVDCPNPIQGNIFWQKHLSRFELNWSSSASQYPFLSQVQRQPNRDENFAFYFRGVLFFGIDMVQPQNPLDAYDENLITTPTNGTSKSLAYTTVSDDLAWTRKMMQELPAAADDEPLSHIVIFSHAQPNTVRDRAFFDEMKLDIEALIVPCLYIHGNGHVWEYEQNAFGINSILRVQVDRGGIAAPVKVQVGGTDASTPFTFTRRAVNA